MFSSSFLLILKAGYCNLGAPVISGYLAEVKSVLWTHRQLLQSPMCRLCATTAPEIHSHLKSKTKEEVPFVHWEKTTCRSHSLALIMGSLDWCDHWSAGVGTHHLLIDKNKTLTISLSPTDPGLLFFIKQQPCLLWQTDHCCRTNAATVLHATGCNLLQ